MVPCDDGRVEGGAGGRYEELCQRGDGKPLEAVRAEQTHRDKEDTEREAAPLKPAPDAIQLDSSSLVLSEVVQKIEHLVIQQLAERAGPPESP